MLKDMLKRIKDMLERRRIYVVFVLALLSIAATLMLHLLRKDEPALPKEPELQTTQQNQRVSPPDPSTELPSQQGKESQTTQQNQRVSLPDPLAGLTPPKGTHRFNTYKWTRPTEGEGVTNHATESTSITT